MAEAGKVLPGLGLPGVDAAQWPLQRYGRFMPLGTGEPPGSGLEAGMTSSSTWKVRPESWEDLEELNPERREGRHSPDLQSPAVSRRGHRGTGRNG